MPPTADLWFAVVMVVGVVAAVALTWGKGKAAFEASLRQLEERGYAVTHAVQENRGAVTWVWGRYPEPVPFYFHISNRDPLASMAGLFGVADLEVGHPRFDGDFTVRSNRPEWAREFLTKERCDRLVRLEGIQFLTASLDNTLTPDYWPTQKDRRRRDLWMLRVDGKIEGDALEPYVALARELASDLHAFCAGRDADPKDLRTAGFEGR